MKNQFNKKLVVIILALTVLCVTFAGCSLPNDVKDVVYAQNDTLQTVNIHTQRQLKYITKSPSGSTWYAKGKEEYSKPMPVSLNWNTLNLANGNGKYTVLLSENANMQNAVSYETDTPQLDLINLKIATTYYWQIVGASQIFKFDVANETPRNLSVDGITNVRDLGGWTTTDGKVVKQGLMFRCGRLNESSSNTVKIEITQSGIFTMKKTLGVKSEIDLRMVSNNETGKISSSPLGEEVNYFSTPMTWNGNIFYDNKEQLLEVFSIFANEDNYPLIFHCNIGTDRTGMVAFLINALLGVSEEDLLKDYLFSNLGNIGGSRKSSGVTNSPYYNAIQNAHGSTLKEKTYNALVDYGVPATQLDSIISMML